ERRPPGRGRCRSCGHRRRCDGRRREGWRNGGCEGGRNGGCEGRGNGGRGGGRGGGGRGGGRGRGGGGWEWGGRGVGGGGGGRRGEGGRGAGGGGALRQLGQPPSRTSGAPGGVTGQRGALQ